MKAKQRNIKQIKNYYDDTNKLMNINIENGGPTS